MNSIAFNVTFVGSLGLFISIFCIFLYLLSFCICDLEYVLSDEEAWPFVNVFW